MILTSFVLHGLAMASTYMKYPDLFTQEATNPLLFLGVEILIAVPAAVIFTKTRTAWSAGIGGGVTFGFWLGLVGSFAHLFNPLVMKGFPTYLGWYWVGISMIVSVVLGVVFGLMIKKS